MINSNSRPIQADDLFKLKFLQDAQLSPDGKTIAYSSSWVDDEDKEHEAIWLLEIRSGNSKKLTFGGTKDNSPRWSPDGKNIAFISDRSGKSQIYIIPIYGGEAQPLTTLPQGTVAAPAWSPDGIKIAFIAGPQEDVRDPSKPYRLTRHIYRFNGMGYLDDVIKDLYVVSTTGGEPKRLTDDKFDNAYPQWSPDGQKILFLSGMFPGSHRSISGLKTVDLEGEITQLVGDWGYVSTATWFPDGKGVVFVGNPLDSPGGTHNRLWVLPSDSDEPECRSNGLERQLGGSLQPDMPVLSGLYPPRIFFSEDGKQIYASVQDGGTVQIYKIGLFGPEVWEPVVSGESSCLLLDMVKENMVYAVSTANNPMDLYLSRVDGSAEKRLTKLNENIMKEVKLPTVEQLFFKGTDMERVEGWIMKPAVGRAPYPTVLYIHGGPHSAFGHVYCDWGHHDYEDLMAGVDHVVEKGIADPNRLGCCGLSGGGNLTCWIVGHTDRFKAAVPENPVTNFQSFYGVSDIGPWFAVRELGGLPHEIPEIYARCSPITYAHNCKTPTLLIQGENDYRCPAEQSEQFYAVLKSNGCLVEMLRLPDSSHVGSIAGSPRIRRAQNDALLGWMNRFILDSKASTE
jgi:dipeptidyl aminopeptidase/acylaminoacyl peptidase